MTGPPAPCRPLPLTAGAESRPLLENPMDPKTLRYATTHEWASLDGDEFARICKAAT